MKSTILIVPCALAIVAACTSSSGEAPDAGPVSGDDGGGADVNYVGDDGGLGDIFIPDSMPDVVTNPALPAVLMTAVSAASSTMINPSFTTVFQNGAWSALTMVGANDNAAGGGGVTAIANDEGLAVVAAASGASLESVWTGAWPQLYQIDPSDDIFVSGPVAASPGAFVAEEASLSPYPITLDTFNESGPTWTTGELTGANGDGRCIPVVAATQAGEPLVLYSTTVSGTTYQWSARASGAWSAPASVPGVAALAGGSATASVAAATRVGTDQIVAVFVTGGPTAYALESSTFSAGAWSTTSLVVATDIATSGVGTPMSVAALPDGRIALAYATAASAVNVGFFDGTAWGAFSAVPSAAPMGTFAPVSIAAGSTGAVVELAYIDQNYYLRHTRLTSESSDAAWTWTAPVVVDSTQSYGSVWIASSP